MSQGSLPLAAKLLQQASRQNANPLSGEGSDDALTIDHNRLIEQAQALAPFPARIVRLAQIIANPRCNLEDVAEVIAYDQALTLKMLRAANSAAEGAASHITNVKEAITRLGAARILSTAVAAGARPHFQNEIPAYGLEEGALWKHSVTAAVAAETIPKYSAVESPPEAFTAALLHDVGKTVMGRFLSPEILTCVTFARVADHLTQAEAESKILGMHHGELGGLIAEHWKLPDRVIQGIIHHHSPEEGNDIVCDLTYLANEIAHRISPVREGEIYDDAALETVAKRLGINTLQIAKLRSSTAARVAQVTQRYNAV